MAQGTGGVPFASTALYVGDLEPNVTEAQLGDIFSRIGPLGIVRVCRDKMSHRSLGYAYVNFVAYDDACRAVEQLNFTPVNGKPLRIMFSYRDPSIRRSGSGNLFVKNLDPSVDNKALMELFAPFGKILSCKVAMHEGTAVSKGHGFVQFESEDSAHTATEKLNGTLFHEKRLFVGPFVRRQERDSGADKFSNLFVKNLPDSVTEEDLQQLFGEYGTISSAVVMKEADGKSKCFGFVNFKNAEDAAKAVENLNGKDIQGKELYVGRAQKKTEREAELKAKFVQDRNDNDKQSWNLYVKNLDDNMDEQELKSLFAPFGKITSCKVMRDPLGNSKGTAFVAFSTPESANVARTTLHGKMIGKKPMYVNPAQTKEERKALLQAAFASRGHTSFQPLAYGHPSHLLPQQHVSMGFPQQMLGVMRPDMVAFQGPMQGPLHGPSFIPHRQKQPVAVRHEHQHFKQGQPSNRPISVVSSAMAAATPEEQRMILGNHLYSLVSSLDTENAGKITGMLLEMDQTEVLHLLESPEELKAKIAQAMDVLHDAHQERLLNAEIAHLSLGVST